MNNEFPMYFTKREIYDSITEGCRTIKEIDNNRKIGAVSNFIKEKRLEEKCIFGIEGSKIRDVLEAMTLKSLNDAKVKISDAIISQNIEEFEGIFNDQLMKYVFIVSGTKLN